MPKTRFKSLAQQNKAGLLYQRAEEEWRRGRLRSAFRCFLAAARAGEVSAFVTVGCCYDFGRGVKPDEEAALYWYRRAYRSRSGTCFAANNIGCIWRDRGRVNRALHWFRRTVRLGDADANLNIAKIYLVNKRDPVRAARYLTKARKSPWATEGAKEEAKNLMEDLRSQMKEKPKRKVSKRAHRNKLSKRKPGRRYAQ